MGNIGESLQKSDNILFIHVVGRVIRNINLQMLQFFLQQEIPVDKDRLNPASDRVAENSDVKREIELAGKGLKNGKVDIFQTFEKHGGAVAQKVTVTIEFLPIAIQSGKEIVPEFPVFFQIFFIFRRPALGPFLRDVFRHLDPITQRDLPDHFHPFGFFRHHRFRFLRGLGPNFPGLN